MDADDVDMKAVRHAALQCAQMPEISITGVFGEKPAAREADLMVSATAAPAASPTEPHFSQIRNTTGSPLSWLCTHAMKALRLSIRCTSPCSRRKSSARYIVIGAGRAARKARRLISS